MLQRIHQAWVSIAAMRISPPEAYPNFTSNIAWNFFCFGKEVGEISSNVGVPRSAAYIEHVAFVWSYGMTYRPRDLADRMADRHKRDDGYRREVYALPRAQARTRAKEFLISGRENGNASGEGR